MAGGGAWWQRGNVAIVESLGTPRAIDMASFSRTGAPQAAYSLPRGTATTGQLVLSGAIHQQLQAVALYGGPPLETCEKADYCSTASGASVGTGKKEPECIPTYTVQRRAVRKKAWPCFESTGWYNKARHWGIPRGRPFSCRCQRKCNKRTPFTIPQTNRNYCQSASKACLKPRSSLAV